MGDASDQLTTMKLRVVTSPRPLRQRLLFVVVFFAGMICYVVGMYGDGESRHFHWLALSGLVLQITALVLSQRKAKHRLISLFAPTER